MVACLHEEDLVHDLEVLCQFTVVLNLRQEDPACLLLGVEKLLDEAVIDKLLNGLSGLCKVEDLLGLFVFLQRFLDGVLDEVVDGSVFLVVPD